MRPGASADHGQHRRPRIDDGDPQRRAGAGEAGCSAPGRCSAPAEAIQPAPCVPGTAARRRRRGRGPIRPRATPARPAARAAMASPRPASYSRSPSLLGGARQRGSEVRATAARRCGSSARPVEAGAPALGDRLVGVLGLRRGRIAPRRSGRRARRAAPAAAPAWPARRLSACGATAERSPPPAARPPPPGRPGLLRPDLRVVLYGLQTGKPGYVHGDAGLSREPREGRLIAGQRRSDAQRSGGGRRSCRRRTGRRGHRRGVPRRRNEHRQRPGLAQPESTLIIGADGCCVLTSTLKLRLSAD